MSSVRNLSLLILVSLTNVYGEGPTNYTGYQVLRISPKNIQDVEALHNLQRENPTTDFWRQSGKPGHDADVMVAPDVQEQMETWLQSKGLSYSRIIKDVQGLLNNQGHHIRKKRSTAASGNSLDLENYNRYDQIVTWMSQIKGRCGSRCDVINIGQSYEGRDLKVFKIGSNAQNPKIFLECGVHAREWIAPAVCINLINKLASDYDSDTGVRNMVDRFNWLVLAVANPDGYEYTHTTDRMWRKNRKPATHCFGTDINRNFDYHWGEVGASTDPCQEIYQGPSPFSEPEAAAIRDFTMANADTIRAYLSLHSYGQYILIPWAYSMAVPSDYIQLRSVAYATSYAMRRIHGKYYAAGHSTRLLGATGGSSDDWAKGTAGIKFSYTLELRDTGYYAFIPPPSQIKPNFEEIFAGLSRMSQVLHRYYPMRP